MKDESFTEKATDKINLNPVQMKMNFRFPLALITFISLLLGCQSSDDNEAVPTIMRIEVTDANILTADVNSESYWDNAELVWSDEFDGSNISYDNWLFEDGSVAPSDTELQNYTREGNFEVSDGTLKIIAKKTGDGQKKGDYTSARIGSKFSFTYGQMEIRAKVPDAEGSGIWAKLWLLGDAIQTGSWPDAGEIDIMEYLSRAPNSIQHTIHSAANNQANGTLETSGRLFLETAEEEFHIYGLLWTPSYLKFYIDDIENITHTFEAPSNKNDANWPFSKPFYFLMNIVVGGNIAGSNGVDDTIFPTTMEVDYVRVYHARP